MNLKNPTEGGEITKDPQASAKTGLIFLKQGIPILLKGLCYSTDCWTGAHGPKTIKVFLGDGTFSASTGSVHIY